MLKFKIHCKTAVGLNAKDFCYCTAWANASNSYLACQKFTGPTQKKYIYIFKYFSSISVRAVKWTILL